MGLLPKTEIRNKYIFIITDRYSKVTKSTVPTMTTAARIPNTFMEHWAANFGTPAIALTYNGPQFNLKIFATPCKELSVEAVSTTE